MLNTSWFSIGLIALIMPIVVLAGIKKQPSIGITLALIILGIAIGSDKQKLSDIGFSSQKSWLPSIHLNLWLRGVISFVSVLVIESAAEIMANHYHALCILEKMRGNWKQLPLLLTAVCILVSFFEGSIFRGFPMSVHGSLIRTSGIFAPSGY